MPARPSCCIYLPSHSPSLCVDSVVEALEANGLVEDAEIYDKVPQGPGLHVCRDHAYLAAPHTRPKQDNKGQWTRKLPGKRPEKYCATCHIWRPPRTSHCKICGRCMVRCPGHRCWMAVHWGPV